MKKQKKLIVVINKFPTILYMITRMLQNEAEDYILDASQFEQPVSLLTITQPDELLLNLKLPRREALKLIERDMQDNFEINQGMITSNSRAYYMDLCRSLSSHYFVDNFIELKLLPDAISKQQLN